MFQIGFDHWYKSWLITNITSSNVIYSSNLQYKFDLELLNLTVTFIWALIPEEVYGLLQC